MSKSKVTIVGPATVRAAFQNGDLDASAVTVEKTVKGEKVQVPVSDACLTAGPQGRGRGRVNKAFVAAFLAANPNTRYAEKVESVKTITLPMVSAKTGRPVKGVEVPMTEFRRLSGTTKGKPGRAALEAAAAAFIAERDSGE